MKKCPLVARALLLVLALALAPRAHANWSEQGVVLDTLWHYNHYYKATLLHDPSGAFFVWLPYYFGPELLYLDAAQTGGSDIVSDWSLGSPAETYGPAVALDGSGGLFVFEPRKYPMRLRHVLPNGTQDWGDPQYGLAVGTWRDLGGDLVADGSGGVWAAWGDSGGVRLQHWLAGGTVAPGWSPAGRLFPGNGCFPALARDGAGGVLLFFGDWINERAHVTRVQADTTIAPGWTAAGLDLGAFSEWAMMDPEGYHSLLLPSGDTGWIAIWEGGVRAEGTGPTSLIARRVLADGTLDPAWAGGAPLTLVTSSMYSQPDMFSDGAGGFHQVWVDSATRLPRWLHVTAGGGCATGFGWNGISPLRAGDGFTSNPWDDCVAAPSDNGGIVFAWDDIGAGRARAIRLRWLMPDGTNDPAAPDTGRVIPGTNSGSHLWGLAADGAGAVWTLWSNDVDTPGKAFLMNHMARVPYVADVPPPAPATALALAAPRPTPTRGALDVRCTLAGQAPARLSLFDVNGRRLRDVTLQGAGDHVVRLEALGALPPGVYLLQLSQGRESRTARAVILR